MVTRQKDPEEIAMKCHVCSGQLAPTVSDLPFSLGPASIVVIKKLPILECTNCTEFAIEDAVMAKYHAYGILDPVPGPPPIKRCKT